MVKIIFEKLNPAHIAVLGLVAEKDRHPYEINQVIEEREMRNWTDIGKSSIYRILNMLEENELVISRNEVRQGRNLKIYGITTKGKKVVKDFVFNIISNGQDFSTNFELALSNLPQLNNNEIIKAFEGGLESLKNTKEHLLERYNLAPISEKYHIKLLFTKSLMFFDTQIKFMESTLQELKNNREDNFYEENNGEI